MTRQVVKANLFRSSWIIVSGLWGMFAICFPTVIENIFGLFQKEVGHNRLRWWSRNVVRSFNMDLKVYGEEHVNFENGQRYVIMSNHTSLMDIPVVLHALGSTIRFMSKDSILKIPIIGSAMRASGFVSIDRKSGFQAKRTTRKNCSC